MKKESVHITSGRGKAIARVLFDISPNSGINGELHEERRVRDGAAAAATQLTLFPEYVACPSCDGQGRFPSLFQEVDCANAYVRCGLCDGTGEVISMFYSKRF